MSMTVHKQYLTDVEAATRHNLSRAWFQRKRWEGGGPVYTKMPGKAGRVLYSVEALDTYFEGRQRTSTSDPGPASEMAQGGRQAAKVAHIGKGSQAPTAGCSSHNQGQGGEL